MNRDNANTPPQIRLAYFFAFVTFLLNFIPNVGPVVATFVPLPIVIFDPELSFGTMLLVRLPFPFAFFSRFAPISLGG